MKKIFIFIMIIFFVPNVFAQDFNVSKSDITSPQGGGTTGTYSGLEIYNTGINAVYKIGTRYSGRLSRIWFNLASGGYADPEGFEKGHTYTLTMNMATEDWRNKFGKVSVKCDGSSGTELSNGKVTYVSYKKIRFSFTTPSSTYCSFVYIDLKSTNVSSTAFTGDNNWNLSSLVITDPYYSSGSGSGSGSSGTSPTPTPTPSSSNQDIINNDNRNTASIITNDNNNTDRVITNNNKNTEDLIENNTQNTDRIIDNQTSLFTNKCNNLFNVNDYIDLMNINSEGEYISVPENYANTGNGVNYVSVSPGKTYTIRSNVARQWVYNFSNDIPRYDYFGTSRVVTSGSSITFTVPSGNHFFNVRSLPQNNEDNFNQNIMLVEGSSISSSWCEFGSSTSNKIDDNTKAINDLNDTMKNDNIDDKSSFFTDFEDNDFGLSSIITIPLTTIQQLTNTSCVALSVPIPFTNTNITLPCMTEIYQNAIPTIFNIWQVVSFGIISYFICIDIFKMVKGFKDPNEDKVEVLDL